MTVRDLITILETMNPEANVLLAVQEQWPFEHSLQNVLQRSDFSEADDDECSADDVLLVEGRQLRYGDKAAWYR